MPRELSQSYAAVHQRLTSKRGRAADHLCSADGCAAQAQNWAWQLTGPFIESEPNALTAARKWGTNIEDYAPMCRRHAARLDMGGTLTHCPMGHERTPENTYEYPDGSLACSVCKRQRNSDRKRQKLKQTCPTCGTRVLEQNLAAHVATVHTRAVSKAMCSACGTAMHKRNLSRHNATAHGEKT